MNPIAAGNWRTGKILATLLFIVLAIHRGQVYSKEKTFYSIHLASFQTVEAAGKYVNELASKEKVVFWKETDVPGKGIFFRAYIGKYEDREEAIAVWNGLKDLGQVSYFGVHEFSEPLVPEDAPDLTQPTQHVRLPKEASRDGEKLAPTPGRFVDHKDGTVTDLKTRLMWVKNGWRLEFFAATTWQDAIKKCENFRLGNHSDWRLPTVEEWESVIDKTRECPALVKPSPFNNVIVHMPYWSRTEFIYGPDYTCDNVCPIKAYTVNLYYGSIHNRNKSERAFVLPVRELK